MLCCFHAHDVAYLSHHIQRFLSKIESCINPAGSASEQMVTFWSYRDKNSQKQHLDGL